MHAIRGIRRDEGLVLLALLSLFTRSEDWPEVLTVGSVALRLHDLLLAVVVLVVGRRLLADWRPRALTALGGATLLALLVAAARSPVRETAFVSVAKLAEFVLVGVVIAAVLQRENRPERVTLVLAAGIGLNAVWSVVNLLRADGLTSRVGALLGTETAATAAAAVVVWCVVRLLAGAGGRERRLAFAALAASLVVLAATKSVLAAALGPALVAIVATVNRRWLIGAVTVGLVVLAGLAAGRAADVRALVDAEAPPAPTTEVAGVAAPLVGPGGYQGGSFVHRLALGHAGLVAVGGKPLLGEGWQSTPQPSVIRDRDYDAAMVERFPRLDPGLYLSTYPTHFHNAYVQVAAEAGVPALLLFVALLVTAFSRSVRGLAGRRDPWALAGLGWLALMACHFLGNVLFGGSINAAILGMGLASAGAATVARPTRAHSARVAAVTTGLAVLVIAALAAGGGGAVPATARVTMDGSSLTNGYVRVTAAAGGPVTVAALDSRGQVAGAPVPLLVDGAPAEVEDRAPVQERSAAGTVDVQLESGGRLRLTVLLGVPGIYVAGTPQPVGLALPPSALAAVDRGGTEIAGPRDLRPAPLEDLRPVAAVDFGRRLLATLIPVTGGRATGGAGVQVAPAGSAAAGTVFAGLTPVPSAAWRGPTGSVPELFDGIYAVAFPSGAGYRARSLPTPTADWPSGARAALPLTVEEPAVLGVNELTAVAIVRRGDALTAACLAAAGDEDPCP